MLEFCKGDRQRYKDKKEEPRNEAPFAFDCPNQYSYFKKKVVKKVLIRLIFIAIH